MVTDYLLLIIPSLAVMGGAWWAGRSGQPQGARRRLLLLLAGAVLLVALLAALIWFNPYGRSISSSLAAFGLLPVLVALFVLLLNRPAQWLGLWRSDRLLLSILLILLLVAFGWLYAAQPSTFWLVVGLTASFGVVWWLGTRPGLALPMVVRGIALVCIFLGGGGWLILPGMLAPEWLRIGLSIAAGLSMVLCIFLAAALLYAALRNGLPLQRRHALPRLALGFFLVLGSAYYILWDGIWSSAHARAFEDHWPFAQFLFSLLAGLVIFFLLRGRLRLAGPGFTVFVTAVYFIALSAGWRISAFAITERRAERLEAALQAYYQDQGQYPAQLGDLTPRYQRLFLPPVVVSVGGWCYQGSGDAYRLGYVSGEFTYSESEFFTQIYSQSGDPDQGEWDCETLVRRLQAGGILY